MNAHLTPKQSETFAILLREGFDYIPSYETSVFYGENLSNARDYARSRQKPSKNCLKINAICDNNSFASFEMDVEKWKEMSLLNFINKMENKLNEMHLTKTMDYVKRLR